jgi:hypothetical protein
MHRDLYGHMSCSLGDLRSPWRASRIDSPDPKPRILVDPSYPEKGDLSKTPGN